MDLQPEVLASIIKVAGKWSLSMATTPHPIENPSVKATPHPGEVTKELETHFNWAFIYLEKYMQEYTSKS